MGYERTRSGRRRGKSLSSYTFLVLFNHPFPPYLTPLTVPLLPSPSSYLPTSHPQENFHWFGSIVAVLAAFAVVAGYGTYKLMVSR